jgi:hypothetical protein
MIFIREFIMKKARESRNIGTVASHHLSGRSAGGKPEKSPHEEQTVTIDLMDNR